MSALNFMAQWCDTEVSSIAPASIVKSFTGWIILPMLKLSQNQWDLEIIEAEHPTVVRVSPTSCIFASLGTDAGS